MRRRRPRPWDLAHRAQRAARSARHPACDIIADMDIRACRCAIGVVPTSLIALYCLCASGLVMCCHLSVLVTRC